MNKEFYIAMSKNYIKHEDLASRVATKFHISILTSCVDTQNVAICCRDICHMSTSHICQWRVLVDNDWNDDMQGQREQFARIEGSNLSIPRLESTSDSKFEWDTQRSIQSELEG